MPTYSEIQKFVQRHHDFVPQTTWITHVRVGGSLSTRQAPNTALGGVVASYHARPTSVRPSNRLFGISV